MTSTPLNEEAPDSAVSADQAIKVFETPDRDFPKHGSFLIRLRETKSHSSLWQVTRKTAESLRDQLNSMLAVPADTVNSVEELDALPQESVIRSVRIGVIRERCATGWLAPGADGFETTEDLAGRDHVVLYRPEANDGR